MVLFFFFLNGRRPFFPRQARCVLSAIIFLLFRRRKAFAFMSTFPTRSGPLLSPTSFEDFTQIVFFVPVPSTPRPLLFFTPPPFLLHIPRLSRACTLRQHHADNLRRWVVLLGNHSFSFFFFFFFLPEQLFRVSFPPPPPTSNTCF